MLKVACIILSIEEGIQFVVSVLSLIVSVFGKYAPFLRMVFTNEQLHTLDAKYIATTKALAIMPNEQLGLAVACVHPPHSVL